MPAVSACTHHPLTTPPSCSFPPPFAHKQDKASSPALLATFTVVVTTYGTLGQEAPAKERQGVRIRKQGTHAAPIDLCSLLDEEEEEGAGAAAAAAAASGEDSKGASGAGSVRGLLQQQVWGVEACTTLSPLTGSATAMVTSHSICMASSRASIASRVMCSLWLLPWSMC